MGGKFAMRNGPNARYVRFTVNVPMWEVSILKKRLFQANIDVANFMVMSVVAVRCTTNQR